MRLRFSSSDSLKVLRAVLVENPFENNFKWEKIHAEVTESTGKSFTLRAVREHLQHLLKLYTQENLATLKKSRSSNEEEFEEKIKLLQEVLHLQQTCTAKKKSKQNVDWDYIEAEPQITIEEEGTEEKYALNLEDLRLNIDESKSVSDEASSTTRPLNKKRRLQNVDPKVLEFLKSKQDQEYQIEQQKLALEEKKLEIQQEELKLKREKFEFEKEERRELVQNQTNGLTNVLETQHEIMQLLLRLLQKNRK